jgi:K319L-like, PKD domain
VSSPRRALARGASRLAPILMVGSMSLGSIPAFAQSPARPDRPTDEPTPIASTRSSHSTSAGMVSAPNLLRASAKVEGTPSPGLQVTLDGTSSAGGRMWYRWLQTQGPKVEIVDATKPDAHFIVPADASTLGFVLVVGNASGVDAKAIQVEVEDPERDAENGALKADAGDEQSAKVGRRVVLNGVRSEPKGKLRFRWVQAGGPKVALRANDGPTASFVPTLPGTYQFALIVATTTGALSEPSMVTVTVGGTLRATVDGPAMSIDELARASLASIEGGTRYADDLSKAFDSVADGINTFKTFSEAISETTRRLDAVVPRDKERRAVWIEQLFSPLMAKVVAGMRVDGLDLSQPEAQGKPLTRDQRARLAEQFRYTAAGLRASKTMK